MLPQDGGETMDTPISRAEHEEFVRRMEDEHARQDSRISILEDTVNQIHSLTTSVAELAQSMKSMVKEQELQGKRLETLENRDGEKWRKMIGYAGSAAVGIIIGFLFKQIGIG